LVVLWGVRCRVSRGSRKHMWILVLMILIMPFEMSPYLAISDSFLGTIPDFTVIKALGMMGLVWSGVQMGLGRASWKQLASPQTWAFLLFVLAALFAGLANGALAQPLTRLLAIVCLLPVVVIAARREADLRKALVTSALISVLIFPYAYRQMLRFGGRLGVGLYEPNYLALALVLLLPLLVAFARDERVRWRRLAWWFGAGIVCLEVVLTGSRGGFLGLVVVAALIVLKLARHRLAAFAVAGVVAALFVAVPTTLRERLTATVGEGPELTGVRVSTHVRLDILKAGLRMVVDNPVTGVGLGNFRRASGAYGAEVERIAHNTYLQVAAELGLPALAAFLAVLFTTWGSLRRAQRYATAAGNVRLRNASTALEIGIIGWAVSAVFLSAQFEKFFWLVVFLSVPLERIARRQRRPLRSRMTSRSLLDPVSTEVRATDRR
jgi:O-antigen ligase